MADEVERLFDRYLQRRSRRLRNEIVEAHLDLVEHHVSRFSKGHTEADDVRQQAMLALIGAVERFDPDGGASFKTFADRTVEGELKRLRRDKGWSVRPPRRVQELALHVRRSQVELAQRLGRQPTVAEIADRLHESPDRVLEAVASSGALQADSLDSPVPGADTQTMGDSLSAEADGHGRLEDRLMVEQVLDQLDERDRQVLTMRFSEQRSQDEIAATLGVSQSYLSRLLRQAIERARQAAGTTLS